MFFITFNKQDSDMYKNKKNRLNLLVSLHVKKSFADAAIGLAAHPPALVFEFATKPLKDVATALSFTGQVRDGVPWYPLKIDT